MEYYIGEYYISDGTKPIELKVKAPIVWIPLESNNQETLLISKYVLDWELFGEDGEVKGWTDSYLRKYLNEPYDTFFIVEEKAAIIEKSYGKLFVLSEEELEKYFPDTVDRRAQIHFVNKNADEIEVSVAHSPYWLRDVLEDGEVANVDALGEIDYGTAERDEIGVRPCMYVNTNKARVLTAKAGYNDWHHFWRADEF